MTIQTSSNKFGVAKWIVDPVLGQGTHQTITAAYASASSGDTISVRPGTYTEDPPVKPGTNLVAFNGDQLLPNVTIVGKCTMTGAGTSSISNIRLQTNSDFAVAVTGSAASVLSLQNCYLNCTNNTGISFTSSSSSAIIGLNNCSGASSSQAYFAASSSGLLNFSFCNFGNSSVASTISAGQVSLLRTNFANPITTSGTATYTANECQLGNLSNATNLTVGGSGGHTALSCDFQSGTASAISIGAGTSLTASLCYVTSSNTNAITGLGTLVNAGISFYGTSSLINTTTQTARNFDVGGISFDGGTNVMSNYKADVWTPTLIGSSTAGTTTYTAQNGYYIRVGNLVTVQANVAGSGATGTGSAIFGDLPFTIKNQTGGNPAGSVFSANNATWVFPAGTTCQAMSGVINTTTASIYCSGTATAGGNLQMANAAFNFFYTMTYQI